MGKVEIHGVIASPFVRTVMIVCENIGVPYELKILDPVNKNPEFKKLNPQQTIPVLVDDGFILQESHAIIQYLMDKYAKNDSLYPKDLRSRAVINARLDFVNGTFMPKIASVLWPVLTGKEKKISEEGLQTLKDVVTIVEEFLTKNKWVAGSAMTIADISLGNLLIILSEFQIDLTEFSKTKNWLQEIKRNEIFNKIYETGMKSWRERFNLNKTN